MSSEVTKDEIQDFKRYQKEFSDTLALPFYHLITDEDGPHVKHLYTFRNVEAFIADLDFLCAHYRPIDLGQLLDAVRNNKPLPEKSFFLSFDDGFRELHDIVAPILIRKGIPATFFINKNFTDNKELFYRNKASLLIEHVNQTGSHELKTVQQLLDEAGIHAGDFKTRILSIGYDQKQLIDEIAKECDYDFDAFLTAKSPYLTSAMITSMIDQGFTFGAHSIDHPRYSTIPLKEQIRQTRESMDYVVSTFNVDYKVFAFPFSDLGVSSRFYQTIDDEHILDLSFGTAEMIEDLPPNNIQRIWFENTELNAEELLTSFYKDKKDRIAKGTDLIRRPFGELRTYTIGQMKDILTKDLFWKDQQTIPITKYRMRSHVNNPRASDEDLGMVAMFDGDVLIGYLGVLPDTISVNGKATQLGWLTCWWTSPEYTGKRIGQDILTRIYEWYDGHIGCSEYSALGQKAANRSGKFHFLEIPGKTYHFAGKESDANDADRLSSWLADSNRVQNLNIEYVNEIDDATQQFILEHRKPELANRSQTELNWLLRYPWVLSAPFKDITSSKLFFSSVAEEFYYLSFKIFNRSNRLISFVILKVRDSKATIPYFYCIEEPEAIAEAMDAIACHMAQLKITELKIYNTTIIAGLSKTDIPIHKSEDCLKLCYFSQKIDLKGIDGLHIQDGDGDNAFT